MVRPNGYWWCSRKGILNGNTQDGVGKNTRRWLTYTYKEAYRRYKGDSKARMEKGSSRKEELESIEKATSAAATDFAATFANRGPHLHTLNTTNSSSISYITTNFTLLKQHQLSDGCRTDTRASFKSLVWFQTTLD